MRLSARFEEKVQKAIDELPILQAERKQIDYEIIPAVVPAGQDLITTFVVAMFMPSGPDDYVSHMGQASNPYAAQNVVSNLVRDLYRKIREEIDTNLSKKSGLVLP